MNRYQLVHVTEFQYDGPVTESYNEVRLRPMHDDHQSCLSFRLTTTPASRSTSYHDALGNWVHQFNILAPHRYLRIQADSVVLTHEAPTVESLMTLDEFDSEREDVYEDHYDFVAPTAYVPHLPALEPLMAIAEKASGGTVTGFARAASDLINQRFSYVKGATHVHSSIADSLSLGAGVCQDFAHLLLGLVRRRGLPGRYVSGYLVPDDQGPNASKEQVIGGQATHAWTEVYLPHSGWMALDPTLGTPVGLQHIRVAYGRDYGDIAPVRGVYNGHAGQRLSVDVLARPALDEEGNELPSEMTAGIVDNVAPEDRAHQPQQ
ncbi:MAG TPA: transglutaminase family protein [Terriglobales bacterium]|nr:transglutaminase family protein [Terriglobales bacterium]